MARWRDVKKGKIEHKNIDSQEIVKSSPILIRLKSFLVDTFMITMPIMYIVTYLIIGSLKDFSENRLFGWSLILIPHLIIIVFMWYKNSQTVGMKAYNIILVNFKDKKNIGLIQAFSRYIFMTISLFTIIPLFITLFTKDKRAIYDILSGTIIINK